MSQSAILKSSIAKKYWMAATGLFLCLFLVGHLAGNLQLFKGGVEGQTAFNEYAKFMTTNPAVKILSWLTYFSILFHAIDGILLTIQNRAARPVKYAYNKPEANSKWASRNMALLGSIVLIFIVMHMANFWWVMHYGAMPTQTLTDGTELKDLHTVVYEFFKDPSMGLVFTLIYVVAMVGLAFHLMHGFQSAFQSIGVNSPEFTANVKKIGNFFAIAIPALFALIPLYIHFIA